MLIAKERKNWMWAVIGIVGNAIGVLLMVRYGLPNNLPRLGQIVVALTGKDVREDERRKALGFLGLVALVAGTVLQVISVGRGVF